MMQGPDQRPSLQGHKEFFKVSLADFIANFLCCMRQKFNNFNASTTSEKFGFLLEHFAAKNE